MRHPFLIWLALAFGFAWDVDRKGPTWVGVAIIFVAVVVFACVFVVVVCVITAASATTGVVTTAASATTGGVVILMVVLVSTMVGGKVGPPGGFFCWEVFLLGVVAVFFLAGANVVFVLVGGRFRTGGGWAVVTLLSSSLLSLLLGGSRKLCGRGALANILPWVAASSGVGTAADGSPVVLRDEAIGSGVWTVLGDMVVIFVIVVACSAMDESIIVAIVVAWFVKIDMNREPR
jgi:hypothetical protein